MSEEPLYELRKDVDIPGNYWRAGLQKTEKEWIEIFHMYPLHFQWCQDWFLCLTPPDPEKTDRVREIVKEVFSDKGLKSISYKEAAEECVHKALLELSNKLP